MSTRQQVFWSPHKNSYEGFTNNSEDSKNKIAKQALVYMLNGINCCFEFPVCYWMIDAIDSIERRTKMLEVLQAVTSAGVIVKFVVFDGCASNIAMAKLLVGCLDPIASDFEPFFLNPENKEKVYIFLDPCHMVKLIRNTFGNRTILDPNGDKIEWRYIKSLFDFSQKYDFHVHKLTKRHMLWNRNKMSVALATQILSGSTANAIGAQTGNIPGQSVFKICQNAAKFLQLHDIRKVAETKFDFRVIYCLIFRTLDFDQLFKNFNFKCGISHKYSLIRSVILQYVTIISTYYSQEITFEQYDNICRQYYNKITIFRGQ